MSWRRSIWGAADFSLNANFPWIDSVAAAFGIQVPAAQRFVFNSTALRSTSQHATHGSFIVSADVQFHNREELRATLGDCDHLNDGSLLLLAYEKWGDQCPEHLLGEFAFAIWDCRRERLFCCRDHMGFRPFLYWSDGLRFAFAQAPKELLGVPGVENRLNRHKLAALLRPYTLSPYGHQTFHQGILSLRPGAWASVDRSGIRHGLYWKPEIRPELVPPKPAEGFEALRELLFKAVSARVGSFSKVASELSGGLDSSAVTSIAARLFDGSDRKVIALSGVLESESNAGFPDEREYIDEFRLWPNIDIRYLTARGVGPFDSLHEPERFMRSPMRSPRAYLYEAFERAALDAGAEVVLQGSFGEAGPTCHGDRFYTEMALRFRWITLARELRHAGSLLNRSPLSFFAGRLRDILPHGLPGARVLFTPEFRNEHHFPRGLRFETPFQQDHQIATLRLYLQSTSVRTGDTIGGRVRASVPLFDKRIVEFCLAAPPEMKVHNGYSRYLVRGALAGVLPEKIRWRTDKRPFSPDYYVRYNEQLPQARAFLRDIAPNDPVRSIVNVPRLASLLQPVDPRVRNRAALALVPSSIYTICFLRQFPEFRL